MPRHPTPDVRDHDPYYPNQRGRRLPDGTVEYYAPTKDEPRLEAPSYSANERSRLPRPPVLADGSEMSSSYPPRNTLNVMSQRERTGYNPAKYGDTDPITPVTRQASMPAAGDKGYLRPSNWPTGTRMDLDHESYKADGTRGAGAVTRYNNQSTKLSVQGRDRRSRGDERPMAATASSTKVHWPEGHATLANISSEVVSGFGEETRNRRKFLHDHVGRMSRQCYETHKREADSRERSTQRYQNTQDQHVKLANERHTWTEHEEHLRQTYQSGSRRR